MNIKISTKLGNSAPAFIRVPLTKTQLVTTNIMSNYVWFSDHLNTPITKNDPICIIVTLLSKVSPWNKTKASHNSHTIYHYYENRRNIKVTRIKLVDHL